MYRWLSNIVRLLLGVIIGFGLGLFGGWVVWPTEFTEANPAILQEAYRRDYIIMTASAYAVDNNLTLAQQRLAELGPTASDELLSVMIRAILQDENQIEIRQLVQLAVDLGLSSPAMEPYLPQET